MAIQKPEAKPHKAKKLVFFIESCPTFASRATTAPAKLSKTAFETPVYKTMSLSESPFVIERRGKPAGGIARL